MLEAFNSVSGNKDGVDSGQGPFLINSKVMKTSYVLNCRDHDNKKTSTIEIVQLS